MPPVSVPGLAEQIHRGDRLTLGAVRERVGGFRAMDRTIEFFHAELGVAG